MSNTTPQDPKLTAKLDDFKYLINQNVYRVPSVNKFKKSDTVLYKGIPNKVVDVLFGGIAIKIEDTTTKVLDIVPYLDLAKEGEQNSTNIISLNPVMNYSKDFGNYINKIYDIYYKTGIDFVGSGIGNVDSTLKENLIGSILEGLYFDTVILKLKTIVDPIKGVRKKYDVIDGEKRIRIVIDFMEDRFRYKNNLYSSLSKADQYFFKERVFPVIVLDENTPSEAIDKIKQNQNIRF